MKKIKLTFVINNFLLGGVENFILGIVKYLNKEDFDIEIVTIEGSGILESDFKKLNIPIFFLGSKRHYFSFFSKTVWLMSLPLIIIRLALFIRKSKPDIIINSMYKVDILTYLASKKSNIKIISIQHDIVSLNSIVRWFKIKALKKTDKIIAISEKVKQFLIDHFKSTEQKIKIIYNGVDFDKFLLFSKQNEDWEPVFGTIARLDKIKGHIYILEAIKKLKKDNIKLPRFIFAGDGPEKKHIVSFIKKHNLINIDMVGTIKDIGDVFKMIDVFVLPSLSEGLGIAIIEALVAEKLVVGSEVGGIKELITNKKTGILVKKADAESLYQAIKWILENKEASMELRENSFKWINEKRNIFDIKNVSQAYSQTFKELLNN